MFAAVRSSWALFLGIGLIMLGNGLQGSLLGLRASLEGFATEVTGLVMTGYYIGFLAGSTMTPKILKDVGHIRVFAALASLASTAALVHAIFVDPWLWGGMRIVTGFCYAGLYVVAESWLNDQATNETRGQVLSIYMVITLSGLGAGQLLLNIADPASFELFVLISVLVSLALVPISINASHGPAFAEPAHVGLKEVYKVSPLGVIGTAGTGMVHGAFFAMGAVYARSAGFSVADISLFMGSAVLGGVVLQWPIGLISDRLDRRWVITVVAFVSGSLALLAIPLAANPGWMFFTVIFLFGGMMLPMYSLCIAYTNDHLEPQQMVAASSALVLVSGIGAILGPTTVAATMGQLGPNGFFWCLVGMNIIIALYALFRMTQRVAPSVEDHEPFSPMPPRASPLVAVLTEREVRDEKDRDLAKVVKRY